MRLLTEVRQELAEHGKSEREVLCVVYQTHEGAVPTSHWCAWNEWADCAAAYGERMYMIKSLRFVGARWELAQAWREARFGWEGGYVKERLGWELKPICPRQDGCWEWSPTFKRPASHRLPTYTQKPSPPHPA